MTSSQNKPIAIIGMSCRLPGVDNIAEFLKMLDEGRSNLGVLPPERMNQELQYDPEVGKTAKSYTNIGGVVPEKPFDLDACPVSKELLEKSHPAHLKLLGVTNQAFQQGHVDPKSFQNKVVGTYLGHTPPPGDVGSVMFARVVEESAQCLHDVKALDGFNESQKEEVVQEIIDQVRSDIPPGDPRSHMRSNAFHAASLVSEVFELDGPSMTFDAACASGFQALNFAILALQQGKLDAAVVGSASYCQGDTLVLFSTAQSLSKNGTCPYDENADGLVASEGYVVFLLKTLDQAIQDGDNIQAVIRSVSMSSDGKGKSLWAPRKEGQAKAVERANEKLENPYQNVQYIEMHATSTQVGDATEISALTDVFGPQLPEGYKIPIGSVKANVGHTLETAGLTGLLKTVLSIQTQTVYPQINIQKLNPKIDWDSIPFFVAQQKLNWPPPAPGIPRRAAVNAFGIGGLNVHVIVDEHLPTNEPETGRSDVLQDHSDDDAIAIVGMGSIFPGGLTVDALWETIQSGVDQKSEIPEGRWNTKKMLHRDSDSQWGMKISKGGFIRGYEYDWKKHKVPPKQVRNADPLQFMFLDAADAALADAGYHDKEYDKTRTGVVVGNIFGGEFSIQIQVGLRLPEFKVLLRDALLKRGISEDDIARIYNEYENVVLDVMPALFDETGSFTSSSFASRITKTFNLMGGAVAVDAGDASAISAIESCVDILLAGNCDMMICAAGQRAMGYSNFETALRSGILAKDRPFGPFNPESDGGMLGEGAGVLILKRLSDAKRDGDNIHAIIHGSGASRAAHLQESVNKAASRALQSSKINPEQISLIETSSYGNPSCDKAELAGLAGSYASPDLKFPIPIGSAASQFGNLSAGTGMMSVIKAIQELNKTSLPQQVGFSKEMPVLEPYKETLVPAATSQKIPGLNDDGKLYAGVSCYGQQNRAYHLILEGATRVIPEPASTVITPTVKTPKTSQPAVNNLAGWRITRIGAASFEDLLQLISDASANADKLFSASNADFNGNPFTANDRFRLAIVSENSSQLAKNCQLASKMIANPETRSALADKGIFYSEINSILPKIAFMFPGQGSQYTGMLKDLITHYPPAKEAMDKADTVLAELNLPSFAELAWTEGDHLGQDVWLTQLSLMIADSIMSSTVNSLGISANVVSGHSFGELAAHVAAGTWTFREAVIATRKRCDAIASCTGSLGALLSTSAPKDAVEDMIKVNATKVYVSHCNSPTQTVVGGDTADLETFTETVKAVGYQATLLKVPAAFHTPLMEDVKKPFRESLSQLKLIPPRIPVLSSVNNHYTSDPREIRNLIVTQMTRPIDYVGLVQRLIEDGINLLIEVGPRSVLTGLSRQIVEDNSVQCISTDHQKRNGLQQLLFTRASVEVSGILDQLPLTTPQWNDSSAPLIDINNHQSEEVGMHNEAEGLKTLHLSGSPYHRGFQHGQELQNNIRAILKRHCDLAGTEWKDSHNLQELIAKEEEIFGADGLEEIQGIADGAGVNRESLVAYNLRLYLSAGNGELLLAATAQNCTECDMQNAVQNDSQFGLTFKEYLEKILFVNQTQDQTSYQTVGLPGQVGRLSVQPVLNQQTEPFVVTNTDLLNAYEEHNKTGSSNICSRMVMRVVEQPLAGQSANIAERLSGNCIVIGQNEVADAFTQNLRNSRIVVEQLQPHSDLDQSISQFDEIWNRLQAKHLFILTVFDAGDNTGIDFSQWENRRSTGVFIPFLLTQRWMQKLIETKTIENSSVMSATLLGGDLGFSSQIHAPEGGALAGLMKAVKAELMMMGKQKNYRARTVDFSSQMTTSQIVEALNSEITANDDETEIGYKTNQRYVVRPMLQAAAEKIDISFPKNGAFVITGGARGVTARVAREIGQRYGVKLHLIGSSPLPEAVDSYRSFLAEELKEVKASVMKEALASGEKPLDTWGRFEKALEIDKTLHGFKEDGLSVQYHACDISNKASVDLVLNGIRKSGDVICGVIHGAGFERACRFEKKQQELVNRTIGAKADGAAILMELTLQDPLQYFLAFGSVSGRFGGVGQADYSLSNDLLAKLVGSYRSMRPECHSGVFHWHAWDDVGMAVRPESQHIRSMMDLKFMPAVEGVQHLIDEMESGVPETEIVITEAAFYEKNYVPSIQPDSSATSQPVKDVHEMIKQFPLIDSVLDFKPGQMASVILKFDPTDDIFLIDHKFKGRPILPVAISTEALLQASALLLEENEKIVSIKNIEIVNGMRFFTDTPQEMNVIVERTADGISASLTADFKNTKGKLLIKDKPYLKGIVETSLTPITIPGIKPPEPEQWYNCEYSTTTPIVHGPIFHCAKLSTLVEGAGYTIISDPNIKAFEHNRTGNKWITQPDIVDSCLYSALIVMWFIGDGVFAIPFGIEQIVFVRHVKPGEKCFAETTTRGTGDKFGTFDITLYGEDGEAILKVLGYESIVVGKAEKSPNDYAGLS